MQIFDLDLGTLRSLGTIPTPIDLKGRPYLYIGNNAKIPIVGDPVLGVRVFSTFAGHVFEGVDESVAGESVDKRCLLRIRSAHEDSARIARTSGVVTIIRFVPHVHPYVQSLFLCKPGTIIRYYDDTLCLWDGDNWVIQTTSDNYDQVFLWRTYLHSKGVGEYL